MNNFQKAVLVLALISVGPVVWAASWTVFYPSFQSMYWQQYGEWTPTTFQNYLVMGISGMYVVGFALIAWKSEPTQIIPSELSPRPDPDPPRSEKGLAPTVLSPKHNSDAPSSQGSSVSSPQLSQILARVEEIGKRMKEMEESQKKITPFLRLAPQQEEGDK